MQGSGQKLSRTSDHLMVIKYLIDKVVKGQKKKLYACFVDIKKAFDFTNRQLLFYKLLSEYNVGGNFLKLLQSLYNNHEVHIRLSRGLLQPITTTIGVKQGCGLSPLLFNLFINKLPDIYDGSCDPVKIGDLDLNSLLWADDLVILSQGCTKYFLSGIQRFSRRICLMTCGIVIIKKCDKNADIRWNTLHKT